MTRLPLLPGHTDPVELTRGLPGRPPSAMRLLHGALRVAPGTVDELAATLGWAPSRVRRGLRWLAARGLVEPVMWRAVR